MNSKRRGEGRRFKTVALDPAVAVLFRIKIMCLIIAVQFKYKFNTFQHNLSNCKYKISKPAKSILIQLASKLAISMYVQTYWVGWRG